MISTSDSLAILNLSKPTLDSLCLKHRLACPHTSVAHLLQLDVHHFMRALVDCFDIREFSVMLKKDVKHLENHFKFETVNPYKNQTQAKYELELRNIFKATPIHGHEHTLTVPEFDCESFEAKWTSVLQEFDTWHKQELEVQQELFKKRDTRIKLESVEVKTEDANSLLNKLEKKMPEKEFTITVEKPLLSKKKRKDDDMDDYSADEEIIKPRKQGRPVKEKHPEMTDRSNTPKAERKSERHKHQEVTEIRSPDEKISKKEPRETRNQSRPHKEKEPKEPKESKEKKTKTKRKEKHPKTSMNEDSNSESDEKTKMNKLLD